MPGEKEMNLNELTLQERRVLAHKQALDRATTELLKYGPALREMVNSDGWKFLTTWKETAKQSLLNTAMSGKVSNEKKLELLQAANLMEFVWDKVSIALEGYQTAIKREVKKNE